MVISSRTSRPADYFGMRVSIFLGNGDGTFQPQSDQLKFLLSNPSAIAGADLNADGNNDLVVNDQNNNIADAIAVLPGKGDGTFPQKVGVHIEVGLSVERSRARLQ